MDFVRLGIVLRLLAAIALGPIIDNLWRWVIEDCSSVFPPARFHGSRYDAPRQDVTAS